MMSLANIVFCMYIDIYIYMCVDMLHVLVYRMLVGRQAFILHTKPTRDNIFRMPFLGGESAKKWCSKGTFDVLTVSQYGDFQSWG